MFLLVVCLGLELRGWTKTSRLLTTLWLLGAIAAFFHSLGALATFHHGSHAEALQSTAEQTEEMLGIAFAAGLYFNYVFVAAWLFDASWRIIAPANYLRLPAAYHFGLTGFLVFIAFNGAVVFKSGMFRWAGIASIAGLLSIWLLQRWTPARPTSNLPSDQA
jgi:hypothetical protein